MTIYALRNHLYAFWLALPGFLLKLLYLDSNFLIVNSMYVMHCIVWTFGDYFFFHLARTIGGKQFAVYSLMIALSNETVIRYISHTSMNGIEGNLTMAALYYYLQLRPEIGCKNLTKMTILITITFLARSSSLASWIPLAVLKVAENVDFIVPIIVAGLTVTIPFCIASTLLDSYYYGALTVPQYNFIGINVLENLSIYFGIDPWYYYIEQMHLEFGSWYALSTFGFSLITVKQLSGTLYAYNREMREKGMQRSQIPTLLVYVVTMVFMLSSVDHKERRFYAPITQLACLC